MTSPLRIIPLGGFGEVGRNLTVLELDGDIICIDCGLMFPDSDMPGVDIVLPNFTYLEENASRIKGYFITHGHEDHHGALSYVLPRAPAPVFATKLTRGLIEVKLKESGVLATADIRTIDPDETIEIGPFKVEPFRVSHSIPDSVGFGIETPYGIVVHTAEFKFDLTPVNGQLTDIHRLASFAERGVIALLSDSTNAERAGHTPSEAIVAEALERVFERAPGRIILATFASNISRVQEVINIATEFERKVALVGRSMEKNSAMALQLGYLKDPEGVIMSLQELEQIPEEDAVIVCTGTQGEPNSALVRMAHDRHRELSIVPGDTVVVSASPIPGNEEPVHRTLDHLFRHGADVLYQALTPVHVSGHGSREELALMLTIVAPRYFVPNGGEYRMLALHAKLAEGLGIPRENIFVMESGNVFEIDADGARILERTVPGEYIYVDGSGVGDVGETVLRDRRSLASDGFVVAAVNMRGGKPLGDAEIMTRGFIYLRDSGDILDELTEFATRFVRVTDAPASEMGDRLKSALGQRIHELTRRRPTILTVVKEV